MPITPFSAIGTTLKLAGTTIAGRTKITAAPMTRAKLETTDLDSFWEQSIPGIPRLGELKFEMNWDPGNATQAAVYDWFANGTTGNWTVTLPDAGNAMLITTAYVVGIEPGESAVDAVQKATVTVQPTGNLTLTP